MPSAGATAMRNLHPLPPLLAILSLAISSCSGQDGPAARAPAPADSRERTPSVTLPPPDGPVLFGHQSVGRALLEGACESLGPGCPQWLHEWRPGEPLRDGILHFRVGVNTRPETKIRAFVEAIDSLPPGTAAAAGFKFCFVDFDAVVDVDTLWNSYRNSMSALQARHPSILFYHCTVPLTVRENPGLRFLKRVLGRPTAVALNRRREAFSDRLRAAFGSSGLLFDIAAIENGEDLAPCTAAPPGDSARRLLPGWTEDGAHPAGAGARRLGERFLLFLQRCILPRIGTGGR